MALLKAFSGLKDVYRNGILIYFPRFFCHTDFLPLYVKHYPSKQYQRYCSEASSTRDVYVDSKTGVDSRISSDVQDFNKNEKKTEDGDVFGLLGCEVPSHHQRKFVKKKANFARNSRSNLKGAFMSRDNILAGNNSEKSWPSVFGTLAEEDGIEENENRRFEEDEKETDESEKPYRRLDSEGRKHIPFWYGRRIAKFGKAGKIYEAIHVLEEEMLKQDRVLPNQYVFTVLIGVLGRHGYTKKAFKIFNQMKKFGLAPEDPTYTALFNACSNSPWPEDGLKRAVGLRQLMSEKDHQPNMATYNAIIKAFAMCGDLRTAFAIVDEAIEAGHKPDGYCYSSLLIACVSDKEAGLKHAIEVWRMMRKRKITPLRYHYNLLLRIVRDCRLGDKEYVQKLIQSPRSTSDSNQVKTNSNFSVSLHQLGHSLEHEMETPPPAVSQQPATVETIVDKSSATLRKLEASDKALNSAKVTTLSMPSETETDASHGASIFDMDVPNLLNPRQRYGNLIRIEVPQSAAGNLALLGGLPGILSHMAKDGDTPDIKTFTLLLETVSSTPDIETDLFSAMAVNKVKPDVDFCSLLIRKRNLRKDYEGAKEVLKLIDTMGLKPNVRTFGCLAMGCPDKQDAIKLFEEMEKAGVFPNTEIFDILLYQSDLDFSYKRYLLLAMKSYKVQPNENLISRLEARIGKAQELIVKKERGETVPDFCRTEKFVENFKKFMTFYKPWLLSTNLEPSVHPWAKFVQPTPVIPPDDVEGSAQSRHTKRKQSL